MDTRNSILLEMSYYSTKYEWKREGFIHEWGKQGTNPSHQIFPEPKLFAKERLIQVFALFAIIVEYIDGLIELPHHPN